MFFKRSSKDKRDDDVAAKGAGVPAPARAGSGTPPVALDITQLRRAAIAESLGFKTTAELVPSAGLIGQDRALKAIEFGTSIKAHDFNVFVLGPPAAGKSTAVKSYLAVKAGAAPTPPDWVYVNNFEDENRPRAVELPSGRARKLARAMVDAVDELRLTLPAAFESDDYQARRRAIDEEFHTTQDSALEALNQKAAEQNVAILRTPMGFGMAPMHDGKVVKPEVFNQLPQAMRDEVQARIEVLQQELQAILAEAPKLDKQRRTRLAALNEETAELAVRAALDDVVAEFRDLSVVSDYIQAAHRDMVRNVGLFLAAGEDDKPVSGAPMSAARDARYRRYMVNVVVSNGDGGAPVYEELNPTFGNIIGRVEHVAQMGALVTDFLLIKSGALHRANGGYLIVDAQKLVMLPFAYEALKRALKTKQIRLEQPAETLGLIGTQTLEPESIPLDVKVILLGDRDLYYLLSAYDPDFQRLFKVQADFDDTILRSAENELAYARLIASIVATHGLKPVDASGVARIIDEGARLAEDGSKLSIEVGRIADIVREADYWAAVAGHSSTMREDVTKAIEEHVQRSDRLRDRAQESFDRGVVLVDTDGAKVGQVNGLSVIELGDFAFGRPSRITARVRFGQGRVTDIEREAKLGGPLHSKGVMILWGYLAGRYAEDVPLALAASLVFEQSYGGVDGDSASSAELYALLSALSEMPIKQGIAVTGSVNQQGEVQAIGGVNEKIEGFFDVCSARGLTGEQGVIIPKANVQHLMLHEDVVEAVRTGTFAIWAVSTVDEGIEVLTGCAAGARAADGRFPEATLNRKVEDKLAAFAERAQKMSAGSRPAS